MRKDGADAERMEREVKLVRDRSHNNIVNFFASFWAGTEDPRNESDKNMYLHMFFEYTNLGNMHDWLERSCAPSGLQEERDRQKFIYQSILDIISGVAYIHREIDSLIAYHHDLKPKNILHFGGDTLIWKICDFGHANTKDTSSSSGTAQGTGNTFGTYNYLPPEYGSDQSIAKQIKHGRPFDVYSLGCILLDLATIFKLGWTPDGIDKFTRLRKENTDLFRKPNGIQSHEDGSFFNNPKVVDKWRNDLKSGSVTDQYKALLDLIEEMMQLESSHRIFAWEAEVTMYEICHKDASKEELRELLRKVVQKSSTPLNQLDSKHNPYKRASDKQNRWQLDILTEANWSCEDPGLECEHPGEREIHSTLSDCSLARDFQSCQLFGHHDIDGGILHSFSSNGGFGVVGLYGLSGMGYVMFTLAVFECGIILNLTVEGNLTSHLITPLDSKTKRSKIGKEDIHSGLMRKTSSVSTNQ